MRVIPSSRGARSATRSRRCGPPWTHGSPPVSPVRIRSPDEPTNGRVATPDKALGKSVAGLDMHSCWRTDCQRCIPDASLLRLKTPATSPVPGARDRPRNGRGQHRRPESDGRRPPPRRNVSASPGLLALESRRVPDRARRGGCERVSRRPLRLVRPHDADHVGGAPDLMHFVMPSNDGGNCTWKNEYTATDANHDGHPEYVHGRMLGTCLIDANKNGIPEAGTTIARDVQLWDNDSDGTFNALAGRQGIEAFADPNEDRVHEYTAQGLWTLNIQDANGDKRPESVMVTFAGEQRFDRNGNGNVEFIRTVHAELCMTDTASDGKIGRASCRERV